MLDFHLGTGGIDNLGEHIGAISAEGICWLQRNGFLVKGSFGHFPDDNSESLPPFDDVVLSYEQVIKVYKYFQNQLELSLKTPGFKSQEVDTLEAILKKAIELKTGLSTFAD